MSVTVTTPVVPAAEPVTAPEGAAATATPDVTVEPVVEAPLTVEQLTAQLTEWKGHARTWETRAKENSAAKEALDKAELEKLSETERLQKQLADLTAERDTAAAAALKARVSATTGVPEALLTGTTEDELTASAAVLIAFRGAAVPPANDTAASGAVGSPVGSGAVITKAQLTTMSAAEIAAASKDGRLDHLKKGQQ